MIRKVVFLALAMVMVFFAVAPKTNVQANVEKQQKEVHDEEAPESMQPRLVTYEAIVPAFHVHISHDLLFVIEFVVLQESVFEPSFERPSSFSNFLRVLFRQIISPNAP